MKKTTKAARHSNADSMQALFDNPDQQHWNSAISHWKKDKARYYAVVFPGGLGGHADLSKAYAMLYTAAHKPLYKVPIVLKKGKQLGGATIMFKELELNRTIGV